MPLYSLWLARHLMVQGMLVFDGIERMFKIID
jgi:hypothetical protein